MPADTHPHQASPNPIQRLKNPTRTPPIQLVPKRVFYDWISHTIKTMTNQMKRSSTIAPLRPLPRHLRRTTFPSLCTLLLLLIPHILITIMSRFGISSKNGLVGLIRNHTLPTRLASLVPTLSTPSRPVCRHPYRTGPGRAAFALPRQVSLNECADNRNPRPPFPCTLNRSRPWAPSHRSRQRPRRLRCAGSVFLQLPMVGCGERG